MNNVQEFNNSALGKCRVIGNKENPLFCLKDVCDVLEIATPSKVKDSIENEFGKGVYQTHPLETAGGVQQATFITEPQLYFVLMRLDKPKAKPFRQWVINVVLPSIRKTGGYNMNNKMLSDMYERMMLLQEDMIKLQNRVVDMQYQQLSGKRLAVYSRRMREDIIDCYKNGYSTRVISKMFGISINKVIDILSIELFV